jgi:hypothetical protein
LLSSGEKRARFYHLSFQEFLAAQRILDLAAGDPRVHKDELDQHPVTLPRYYIARYPVTVAQFQVFVQDSKDSLRGLSNHPVADVSWHEARKYCEWPTERLRVWKGTPEPLATLLRQEGWRVTLPSEAEWEKAGRGTEGRIYPWGNDPDPNRANYRDTGINDTTAVGCFPEGTRTETSRDHGMCWSGFSAILKNQVLIKTTQGRAGWRRSIRWRSCYHGVQGAMSRRLRASTVRRHRPCSP